MSGFLLDITSLVTCAHTPGKATPTTPNNKVLVLNNPTVTQTSQYIITSCGLTGTQSPPCATATYFKGATKVFSNGQPLLLEDSEAMCTPTGTPLSVRSTQTKVKAT